MHSTWHWMLAIFLVLLFAPMLWWKGRHNPRLCLLQFLVFAPMGSFLPLLTVHLKALGFTSIEIAMISATQAMGALFTLFFVGQLADRWIAANRCLIFCGFGGSVLLWILPTCTDQVQFFLLSFLFWMIAGPTMTLANAICFAHLRRPTREFSGVRVWGTVSWILSGWLLAYLLSNPEWLQGALGYLRPDLPKMVLADKFRQGSFFAFLLGCYALTLPHTPPRKSSRGLLAPFKALRMVRDRHFAIFLICHFGMCVTFPFSIQNTSLLLKSLGIADSRLSLVLTISQSTEILALLNLPWILGRFGLRQTLLIGMCAWTVALTVLTIGQPWGLVVASLGLHGIFVCCVLVAGQIFVNSQAPSDIRTSAQGLMTFSSGLGLLSGSLLVGLVRDVKAENFTTVFGLAATIGAVLVTIFIFGFHHGSQVSEPEPEPENVIVEEPKKVYA